MDKGRGAPLVLTREFRDRELVNCIALVCVNALGLAGGPPKRDRIIAARDGLKGRNALSNASTNAAMGTETARGDIKNCLEYFTVP